MPFISLSGKRESQIDEIAARLASQTGLERLALPQLIRRALSPRYDEAQLRTLERSPRAFILPDSNGITPSEHMRAYLQQAVESESLILVNCAAAQWLKASPAAVHVKLISGHEDEAIGYGTESAAPDMINYRRFLNTLFGPNSDEATAYDLILSTTRVSGNAVLRAIVEIYEDRLTLLYLRKSQADTAAQLTMSAVPRLKNDAEIEFARMLDMYHMEWRYEPKTFPVEWDEDGNVTLAFSPDFYLPRFDLYLELTTMNQKYVTMKKKKLRKLRELYPGVNVRIIYKRDFAAMMERFETPFELQGNTMRFAAAEKSKPEPES